MGEEMVKKSERFLISMLRIVKKSVYIDPPLAPLKKGETYKTVLTKLF